MISFLLIISCYFLKNIINRIKNKVDIWKDDTAIALAGQLEFKVFYLAHPSSNHNNERLVKIPFRMQETGKGETMANVYFIGSNNLITCGIADVETDAADNDDGNDENYNNNAQNRKKRSNQRL